MKTCWSISLPRVAVVYVFPAALGKYRDNAIRFASSYISNAANYPHDLYVISNGGPPGTEANRIFSGIQKQFDVHDNSGWDIGAFQVASKKYPCDFMVFLGSSAYFTKRGWLERMMEVTMRRGPALYGSSANRGDIPIGVYPHIRTTGFWCEPSLMASYPFHVTEGGQFQRYAFEHGKTCLTAWAKHLGLDPIMVTWRGEYEWKDWDRAPNGFRNGDQSALLVRDRICDPPFWPIK